MQKRPQLIVPAIALGVVFLVIAIIYWVDSAGSLPSFFPGHEAGSTHHHVKHGIAAAIVALGCFVFAWFQTGGGPRSGNGRTGT
ncbi:MAG TPA: hypothetical protein VFN72_06420 [Solirubrobacterales bacterium]|nr:hypothetical protein [Solirubrobacterales bacterium]